MDKKAKILLVDDDADFIESTRTVLESKPYDIIVASNSEEALKKAGTENPDLILLDVIMPGKDGFTAAQQLKANDKLADIPVLMLTSYSSKGAGTAIPRGRGMQIEAEDYIEKPVSPDVLLATVEKYLKKLGY